jgi:hypothetical protein
LKDFHDHGCAHGKFTIFLGSLKINEQKKKARRREALNQ